MPNPPAARDETVSVANHRRAWRVDRGPDGAVRSGVEPLGWDPDAVAESSDDAVLSVEAAGFNYKDALCCAGHPGVMRPATLVPGIDVAGVLVRQVGDLPAGSRVVITGHGLGESRDGGFATHVRAPAEGLLPQPAGLNASEAMALGTAGLTAVLACDRLATLVDRQAAGADEAWLVTGASGGVGMLSVACLVAMGRRVVACTRKPAAGAVLSRLGAAGVAAPEALVDPSSKSLAKARWAGVVDTVGGTLLADVLRSVRPGGAVAAIGMAGGVDLATTVHPFILRGVTLAGIDASRLPSRAERRALWARLAEFWPRVQHTFPVAEIRLAEVGSWAERMRAGGTIGRGVVVPAMNGRG